MKIKFVKQDLWIGVFWKRTNEKLFYKITVYVCLIPCLPIIFEKLYPYKSK
jgi:hypothetical protein